jgi:hypothetical protein
MCLPNMGRQNMGLQNESPSLRFTRARMGNLLTITRVAATRKRNGPADRNGPENVTGHRMSTPTALACVVRATSNPRRSKDKSTQKDRAKDHLA